MKVNFCRTVRYADRGDVGKGRKSEVKSQKSDVCSREFLSAFPALFAPCSPLSPCRSHQSSRNSGTRESAKKSGPPCL